MGQNADPINRTGYAGIGGVSTDIAVTPETEHLRRDIENTRTDMSGTLDAIQQRLSPETLGEQAKDTASEITAQAKDAAMEVVDHALAEVKGQATEVLEQAREVLIEARVTAREVLGEAKTTAREAVEDATTQAKAAVRGATIGKVETMVRSANDTTNAARVGLVETIKANPFPAALAGLGLGWLFINSRNAAARGTYNARTYEATYREHPARPVAAYGTYQASGYSSPGGNPVGTAVGNVQSAAGNVAGQVGDLAGNVAGTVGDAANTVGQTVGDAASTVGSAAGSAAGAVGETVGNAANALGTTASNLASGTAETAGNIVEGAQYQAMRLEDGFQRVLRENPLAVGAATLALGAAIGLALPQTQRENQLLGDARDTLVERAQDLAQETLGKVQNVATEAQSSVQESLQSVKETVKDESKKQGLTQ
jgi:hypothetical protein